MSVNFVLRGTIGLIFRNAVTILFQYFNAYSNYITHSAQCLHWYFAINHNESPDMGAKRILQWVERPLIARNRGRSQRYIRLKYDYNSRLPPKSTFAHVSFVFPADHHEASRMASLTYGIPRSRSPLWRSIMQWQCSHQHPPFNLPLSLSPLFTLNPSLSVSTSSLSITIILSLRLTGPSLFPPVWIYT